ncbi:MAG: ATP-binding cassette domain-containing protein [Propionibacteriaceae bacterium]|nr:ATP-binding cassette domain-containing protein [Propionibacteriaceae bacterium]
MLQVRHLTRRFGELVAVDDVSFDVHGGKFTGFVGGNGAGKTTTMRMIMGLLQPDAGEVRWEGDLITPRVRAQFGYMPEERGLYPKQPVRSQLVYLGELHGMPAKEARAAADALMQRFGLGERTKDKLETLSLGNQQRVQIAAAVIASPMGLILDEPFNGLDPDAVDEMFTILSEFTRRQVPILFSSHQLDLVERLCDDIVILAKGRVVADGPVDELRRAGETHHRILTEADLGWLRSHPGVQILDFDGVEASVVFSDVSVEQAVLREALQRGPVRAFGPVVRPLSDIYREITR